MTLLNLAAQSVWKITYWGKKHLLIHAAYISIAKSHLHSMFSAK